METKRGVTICPHCQTKTILENNGTYTFLIDVQSPQKREVETYFIRRKVITLQQCLVCGEPTVVKNCQVIEQTITYTSSGVPQYHEEIREEEQHTLYPSPKS